MGVQWTEDQQQVIDKRDCNILVAAAAGSGKTAVLVERIITRLTKDVTPLNVDELLIVTFTEAAAAEMKERILAAIEKALEERPNDAHLQKQATLIHSAAITTIHSFCLSVIRDHFHTIDLDPVFRIGEEGELKLLKQDTLNQLLESQYEEGSATFTNFVECVAPGRNDKKVESLILSLYDFSRSNPMPEQWLTSCAEKYRMQTVEELEQSSLGCYMVQMVQDGLTELNVRVERAIQICLEQGGPHHYEEALRADQVQFQYYEERIRAARVKEENVLGIIYQLLHTCMWEPLSRKRPKDVDKDKKQLVQDIRNSNKKIIEGWSQKYFYAKPESQVEDMQESRVLMEELVRLVQAFAQLYQREKQARAMIDFNDMEQFALKILTVAHEGKLIPSKVAAEYQDKFAEVMIDEYQDSNLVQEAILTSVSKVSGEQYNIFMVGDVKQSIYRFRLSRPELFMEKFNTYDIGTGTHCRIDLSKNFRSREEVLESTNYIFYQIMKSYLGGVEYDEKSALYCGANYPDFPEEDKQALSEGSTLNYRTDCKTELLLFNEKELKEAEDVEENSRELEARMVARRIKELVGTHLVFDKHMDGYRPARYRDVVLLTRSLSGWSDVFAQGLSDEGVPASVASREGYFSTLEVALLLDFLRVLDNPKQDIPLAAVLRSMFGNITDNELAMIKGQYRTSKFCDAVYQYAGVLKQEENLEEENLEEENLEEKNLEEKLQRKLRACLARIDSFRKKIAYMGIHDLLWEILQETHYREYIYALPGGEQRRANVDMLLEKATTFEHTSYKGVFNFIRYIEQLQKYEVEYGEANMIDELEDAVRIMSIHKSKGLEFPIVFIIGMGKVFNKRDQADTMVMHLDEGIGIDVISAEKRTKKKSLMKQLIKKRLDEESLGEELRILYVAMTRAKEKLIMTGKVSDLPKKLEALRANREVETKSDAFGYLDLVGARTYLDWVLPSVYLHPQSETRVQQIDIEQLVEKEVEEELQGQFNQWELEQVGEQEVYEETFKKALDEQLKYEYPYEAEQHFKLKMSVTEIKKRAQLLEEIAVLEQPQEVPSIEELFVQKTYTKSVVKEPEFMKKRNQEEASLSEENGAFRGTAYHRFMELWDFKQDYSEDTLRYALEQFVRQKKMTLEMVSCIESHVVAVFMNQSIVQRMKLSAIQGRFYREQPFVLGVACSQVYGVESEETILVQGIIDVYFEEDGELVVLDYKTDKVKTLQELVQKYHAQLDYYGQALEQLTGKRVKEKIIYSLELQGCIMV